ncbi:hypothetical protein H4S08_001944 [Coemansia sp. RSA 1365]|nr:hypothetical protein H4S08_001944 [Coemansia sp. RSA 1365]
MSKITALKAREYGAIESIKDYKQHLKSSMLLPLQDLRPNLITSVVLVVVNVGEVMMTKGTDYMLQLRVADPTIGVDNTMPLSIFRRTASSMPDIHGPGDIMYLEAVKTNQVGQDCHLYNNFCTIWQIHNYNVSVNDTNPIIQYLRQWWQGTSMCTLSCSSAQMVAPLANDHANNGINVNKDMNGSKERVFTSENCNDNGNDALAIVPDRNVNICNSTADNTHSLTVAASSVDVVSSDANDTNGIMPVTPAASRAQIKYTSPPGSATSRFNSPYRRLAGEMEIGRHGDLIVEVLHVEPPEPDNNFFGDKMQRCVVTDYTENPLFSDSRNMPVDLVIYGQRLAWCTIHQVDRINKMPQLQKHQKYWLRGARCVYYGDDNVGFAVQIHPKYMRTILVINIEDGDVALESLDARRKEVLQIPMQAALLDPLPDQNTNYEQEEQVSYNQPEPTVVTPVSHRPLQDTRTTFESFDWEKATKVVPISSIHASQQLNTRFHVRARVAKIFPEKAEQSIQTLCANCKRRCDGQLSVVCVGCQHPALKLIHECNLVLELVDDSARCLVMCPNATTVGKLIGHNIQGALSDSAEARSAAVKRIQTLWSWVESNADKTWVDLIVALVLVPGPGQSAGALVRCLIVVDVSHPLAIGLI